MYVTGVNMASQVQDNKLECKLNLNIEQETNFDKVYEKAERILCNEQEAFEAKAEQLINAWKDLRFCVKTTQLNQLSNILNWAKRHTLNIVLSGDWKNHKVAFEANLIAELGNCEKEVLKLNHSFALHCQKLAKVICDPWGHPILSRLLTISDVEIGNEEFEFFMSESGFLISFRLKKLCESHCEDLALNLVTAYISCCKWAEQRKFNMNLTEDQKRFMLDVYISLLYKYKKMSVILSTLKLLSLAEGLQFVKRFAKKRVNVSKLWRHSYRITHLAAVLFCSAAIIKPLEQTVDILKNLLVVWLPLNDKEEGLEHLICSIRRIMQLALSSSHMYIFCEALYNVFGHKIKTFIIELYIQALTTDLNDLERQKNDNNKTNVLETSTRLADGFLRLADVLDEHLNVARECVLTSFSLLPTNVSLIRIESLARRCGYNVLDTGQWKCRLHPPISTFDEICTQCDECGDFMGQFKLEAALNTNMALNEALTAERLGVSPELCDDLAVILCSPRYQFLSWLQNWKDLHRLCIMYLNNPDRTKNLVTELKFLEIDYSIFMSIKREPTEEKEVETVYNYEEVMEREFQFDEHLNEVKKARKKPGRKKAKKDVDVFVPLQRVTDPDVLKSLRSFRRGTKRSSDMDYEECSTPEKIFVSHNSPNHETIHSNEAQNVHVPKLYDCKNISYNSQNNHESRPYGVDDTNVINYNSIDSNAEYTILDNSFKIRLYPPQTNPADVTNSQSTAAVSSSELSDVLQSSTEHTELQTCNIKENCIVDSKEKEESVLNVESDCDLYPLLHITPPIIHSDLNAVYDGVINEVTVECEIETVDSIDEDVSNNVNCTISPSKDDEERAGETARSPSNKSDIYSNINDAAAWGLSSTKENKSYCKNNEPEDELLRMTQQVKDCESNSKKQVPENIVHQLTQHVQDNRSNFEDDVPENRKKLRTHVDLESNMQNANFCEWEGSFFNKNDEGGHTYKTCKHTKDEAELNIINSPDRLSPNSSTDAVDVATFNTLYDNTKKEFENVIIHKLDSKFHIKTDKFRQLTEKYQLKELKIVLHRLNLKPKVKKAVDKRGTGGEKLSQLNERFDSSKKKKKKKKRNSKKKNNKRSENKNKAQSPNLIKDEYKSSPLQDINPRVLLNRNDVDCNYSLLKKFNNSRDLGEMVPRVILRRLDMDKLDVKAILANVPGLHDTEMIQPGAVDNVVQVVQIAGGRSTTTVQSTNNQTSTQVSPHIQRIGQPRVDKPESNTADTTSTPNNTKSSTAPTNSKPTSTQPSTLINILSQQIIRPGQSSSVRPPRPPPFINILSQQIIRPANTITTTAKLATATSTESQPQTGARIVTSCEQQIINQLVSPVRTAGTLKSVVGAPGADQSRIVQFICKSTDGKLIPVTSFTPNRVVKVATTQTVTSSSPASPNFEDNFSKLVNASSKTKSEVPADSPDSLPKFQQAFGKSVYQNNVESNSTNASVANNIETDKSKVSVKNSTSLNVQPIQGGVIYTRQMPVGQTINLIPPGRGQVFRIAASGAEQISLVKDTVIQNKMSVLLAAALQGKQKNSEAADPESSGDANSLQAAARAVASRPALVQNARIVKPVLQVPSNVIRNAQTNLSSTTLEQLREFDMVYKQVKERSSTSTASESSVLPENSDTSQRISVTYLNQGQKLNCAPVVVVSSYSNLQPAASPALSVASQGSSSPCVTPAPTPTPVLPKVAAAKSSKGKSVKNATMHTAKASPIPKPQQKPQEDEHTTQRIFDILAEYAEQLRNSPDLNNKPAPRRRSNPPTNPSQNSKRKKSTGSKKTGQCTNSAASDIDTEDHRTLGSEDSSCGVVQISMQEDEQSSVTVNPSESNDSTIQPRQQLILTESSNNPTRNLIIADTSVGEALKIPNTAVLVPGNYIMPVSMVKGGQQIAVVSGGSKILATVPARSGPNMLLFQSFLNQNRKTNVSTVKYSTIQPLSGISSQTLSGVAGQSPIILPSAQHAIGTVALGQPLTIKKIEDHDRVNTELLLTIAQPQENNVHSDDAQQPDSSTNIVSNNIETVDLEENTTLSDNSSDKPYTFQKTLITTPIATPVIATCTKDDISEEQTATPQSILSLNLNSLEQSKGDTGKVEERVQSVLVAAGTSNGPMLSHTPPHYSKQSECAESATDQYKDDFLRNGGKRMNNEQKNLQANNVYTLQGKIKKAQSGTQKLDRELQQLCLQRKQAAIERELRLQKSLSEECEDLGVDEPSTSDLFPEADLLFDSNHSPSFDQTSQDLLKRSTQCQDVKEESKLTLFSDDDFLFEPNEYQATEAELEYDDHANMLTNGQSNAPANSEDNTLLQTCTSMSDVTLNSPISPDTYNATTPPPLNKYIHKYTNRKKYERVKHVDHWPVEVSSSEDTTGSTELMKSTSRSPELCSKRNDDELDEGSFKVVHVAISKTECDNMHCANDTDCSLSRRGARRSVKKMCSCCNGSQDATAASRKRPASQPQTPSPHKKIFNKKR